MLKRRVGATLMVINDLVVQSIGFKTYLPIGKASIAMEFLNLWGIDEISLIDIMASRENRCIHPETISVGVKKCFVPLAVGGGISTLQQVDNILQSGADKIILNSTLFHNTNFLSEVAMKYGNQFAVACIDVIESEKNNYKVYHHVTQASSGKSVIEWAKQLEEQGAGEIMINHVNRDGAYCGFDTSLINLICDHVSIPVIAMGGAGTPEHFQKIFSETVVSAAYAGNYFHFNEHSVVILKSYLKKNNIDIRLETQANYTDAELSSDFRILKKDDEALEHMLYTKMEKEII